MMNESSYLEPECLAELIRESRSTVALTGAGISTGAGIPDFRGPAGLYVTRRYDPDRVFDIRHFRRDPVPFYEFTLDFAEMLRTIRPTFTHFLLSALEKRGLLTGVVTQNIDALHHHAGSEKVVEVHGSYWSAECTACRYRAEGRGYSWWVDEIRTSRRFPVPLCPECGGVIKPAVVFFGEQVRDFDAGAEMIAGSDLLLVLGSSLAVFPAALLPQMAGGVVVVVNRGEVRLPPGEGRFFIEEDLDSYFSRVAEFLSGD